MNITDIQNEHYQQIGLASVEREMGTASYADGEILIIDNLKFLDDMEAYKVDFNVCFICIRGKIMLDVNGEEIKLHQGQVFICHSNAMLNNIMVSPDFACKVLCITDRMLKQILQAQSEVWVKALYQHRIRVIDVYNKDEYIPLYTELKRIWEGPETIYKQEIIASLLRAALLELCEKIVAQGPTEEEDAAHTLRSDELFQHFIKSITERKRKKVSVSEYACELYITPKYLSTICKKVSGKSPLEWISEYVMEDIRYYLANTELTIKEISDTLGFPNASFFGKYFKQQLGCTPLEYRNRMKRG